MPPSVAAEADGSDSVVTGGGVGREEVAEELLQMWRQKEGQHESTGGGQRGAGGSRERGQKKNFLGNLASWNGFCVSLHHRL